MTGVSFVIPVRNGARWLDETLRRVLQEDDGRPFEVIVVEDGSCDTSPEIARRHARDDRVHVLAGPQRGAAAAINCGLRAARHPIICQVDQDVYVDPGWMTKLCEELEDPTVAAAQGYYRTDRAGSLWARVSGLDLELRYSGIPGKTTSHVCTGNSAYRRDVLLQVEGFDESLGYGYDNDMSYRLHEAGYSLAFRRDATSLHHWRHSGWSYLRQQYGQGYGRMDLLRKHRDRRRGDDVSNWSMMLHAPMLALSLLLAVIGCVGAMLQLPAHPFFCASLGIFAILILERSWAGLRATLKFHDPVALLFPVVHTLRDGAWVLAITRWIIRRAMRHERRPEHSM